MRKNKKLISACLALCLCLGLVCSALLPLGDVISYAADYRSELWLLDDVNYALVRGARVALSEDTDLSPYQNDTGTMYLPVSIICEYKGASYAYDEGAVTVTLASGRVASLTVGSESWTLDGEAKEDFLIPVVEKNGAPFISILMTNEIFGTYNYYDSSMGLVIFGESKVTGYSTSYSSISSQISTLCGMIMDRPTGETVYADLEAFSGSETHPRLLITADKFADLRAVYETGMRGDPYYEGVASQVRAGTSYFSQYFTVGVSGEVEWKDEATRESLRQPHYLYDENGNRLVGETEYTYTDELTDNEVTLTLAEGLTGDGYDYGGRSNLETYTAKMRSLAFAYQITGEDKYADAFYLYALEMDKWEHWGEGHFLNIADGSYAYAVGYDWIYHAFDDEPEKRDEMADILYRKGVMKGYYSIKYDGKYSQLISNVRDFSVSARAGSTSAWRTINRTNNWQTVCGGGMIVSALAIIENEEYRDECCYVIENYIKSYEKCLPQFAPDGSYPESPTYWAYCVNTLMNTVVALENSCGTSYGWTDAVGLYESFYYAAGISDSDYNIWSYHDTSKTTIDASRFYLAAKIYNDPNLAAYRNEMIFERGFAMSLTDVIFYDPELETGDASMPLDNNMKGIYTATFRSSSNSGAIYTGLHVGPSVHDHSDFDTGNFVLSMGGINWCSDPGSENYNVPGFWETREGGRRFRLYRKSLEGHSSIIIHSDELVHGQKWVQQSGSFPVINTFYSDAYGGYAVSNMKGQYGSTCTSGYRGVLLTNSRRTVVLQDEITFSSPTSLTWVLNLIGAVKISGDGKSLTSTTWLNGEKKVIRLTMLTDDDSLSFRKLGSQETVLDNTITMTGDNQPLACDPEARVVIEATDVTEFNVAVVFDLLGHEDEAVGYSKVDMAEWMTSDDEWLNEANSGIVYPDQRPTYAYQASHFAKAIQRLAAAEGDLIETRNILMETSVYFTDYDTDSDTIKELIKEYYQYKNRYDYEIAKINAAFVGTMGMIVPSAGIDEE